MIQIGIIGSGGYVAGELIRCLVYHPNVQLNFLYSTSQAGRKVAEIHEDLFSADNLVFTAVINPNVDVVFLCLGHGNSSKFLVENSFSDKTVIIDMSNDFRLDKDANFQGKDFVYGLVELNQSKIKKAKYIANPGCFATAIQLGLLPLAKAGLLNDDIHVNAITGSTGAGQSLRATSHFTWRNNNVSIYKAFKHQHLNEIGESILSLQKEFKQDINFIPVRGDFTRGIFASMYTKSEMSEEELMDLYSNFYQNNKFTFISNKTINLKQVVHTNNCLIQVQKIENKVLITSVIDNLLKGAAGQAIQNMNLIFGLEENTGLNLKASYH
ncbi:N-acetyl-gamma-glutamyl-phosphate reductase [Putridiphycobacter roseus]|uniref:N-acetyl-gamma-glutamyl-phosphate reductase n=1 Tax=Putridiphycobacter roseus TaxID=2219161 RepID=A0A2W1NE15_9FLAO|nr:N-acetyl-gamma-glutamyl-phosphate reductase [Putridiphycobacter roseus]PZE17665.1 N-acetyl-gamma-glutamyl-phosphate reductase [Putridiphycobacter roseus]